MCKLVCRKILLLNLVIACYMLREKMWPFWSTNIIDNIKVGSWNHHHLIAEYVDNPICMNLSKATTFFTYIKETF